MGARQVEAERFAALHELAEVSVAAEEVVNEFTPLHLFPTNHFATYLGVTFSESRYSLIHDLQDRRSGRPNGRPVALANLRRELFPDAASCRQVEINSPPHRYSMLRRAAALPTDGFDLGGPWKVAARGCLRKHGKVIAQQSHRYAAGI
ncbi:MAG: hypothetical protein ABIN55_01005 [Aeromicrobium sp.]